MNLSKSAFRRYKIIDSMLRNKLRPYPSMEDIIEACRDKLDYEASKETIQKDIANMKLPYPDGFDAPIHFDRKHWGYHYTDPEYSLSGVSLLQEEIETIRESLELIRAIGGSRISDKFNHAMEKLLSASMESGICNETNRPAIHTMIPPLSRGFEHFDLLYRSIRERVPVSFIHYSYVKRQFASICLHPFLIKEFDNRWYVIGFSESHQEIRTFGLDRISDPLPLKQRFIATPTELQDLYLDEIYGVYPIPDQPKQRISIRVSRLATQYFQAYPLHESQEILKHDSGSSDVHFNLIPSYELARYFIAQGKHVRVKSPDWFIQFTQNLNN